jgi:hypothetical protein
MGAPASVTPSERKDPFSFVELSLKVFGALSATAPLLLKTLDLLPIRPYFAAWLPWVAMAIALVAALIGLFVLQINLWKSAAALALSLVVYFGLVVAFPAPPTYNRLLLFWLGVSYVAIFSSFSFLVAHLALKLAERYGPTSGA